MFELLSLQNRPTTVGISFIQIICLEKLNIIFKLGDKKKADVLVVCDGDFEEADMFLRLQYVHTI